MFFYSYKVNEYWDMFMIYPIFVERWKLPVDIVLPDKRDADIEGGINGTGLWAIPSDDCSLELFLRFGVIGDGELTMTGAVVDVGLE